MPGCQRAWSRAVRREAGSGRAEVERSFAGGHADLRSGVRLAAHRAQCARLRRDLAKRQAAPLPGPGPRRRVALRGPADQRQPGTRRNGPRSAGTRRALGAGRARRAATRHDHQGAGSSSSTTRTTCMPSKPSCIPWPIAAPSRSRPRISSRSSSTSKVATVRRAGKISSPIYNGNLQETSMPTSISATFKRSRPWARRSTPRRRPAA